MPKFRMEMLPAPTTLPFPSLPFLSLQYLLRGCESNKMIKFLLSASTRNMNENGMLVSQRKNFVAKGSKKNSQQAALPNKNEK